MTFVHNALYLYITTIRREPFDQNTVPLCLSSVCECMISCTPFHSGHWTLFVSRKWSMWYGLQIWVMWPSWGETVSIVILCWLLELILVCVELMPVIFRFAIIDMCKYSLVIFICRYLKYMYMWQSWVEIEHYSIVYFKRFTAFEEL